MSPRRDQVVQPALCRWGQCVGQRVMRLSAAALGPLEERSRTPAGSEASVDRPADPTQPLQIVQIRLEPPPGSLRDPRQQLLSGMRPGQLDVCEQIVQPGIELRRVLRLFVWVGHPRAGRGPEHVERIAAHLDPGAVANCMTCTSPGRHLGDHGRRPAAGPHEQLRGGVARYVQQPLRAREQGAQVGLGEGGQGPVLSFAHRFGRRGQDATGTGCPQGCDGFSGPSVEAVAVVSDERAASLEHLGEPLLDMVSGCVEGGGVDVLKLSEDRRQAVEGFPRGDRRDRGDPSLDQAARDLPDQARTARAGPAPQMHASPLQEGLGNLVRGLPVAQPRQLPPRRRLVVSPGEDRQHILRRPRAGLCLGVQHAVDGRRNGVGHGRGQAPDPRCGAVELVLQQTRRTFAVVGESAGERLEEHDSQGVQVGADRGRFASALLRRQVLEGADDGPVLGDLGAERGAAGQAEVEDGRLPGVVDEDVAGLEIPMDHPGRVDLCDHLQKGDGHVSKLVPGAHPAR